MMHLCIVATLCFFKIISPRNYYFATRTIFPGSMVQSMYLNLTIANFFFVFYILDVKSFRTYRNINISNQSILRDRGPCNVFLQYTFLSSTKFRKHLRVGEILRGGGQSRDKGKLLEPLQTSPWKRKPFQPQDIFRICGFASLS